MTSRYALRGALLVALGITGIQSAEAASLGRQLKSILSTTAENTALEVIVTFPGTGAPTAAQRAKLTALGLKGVTLNALPIAGVLATPAQIRALQADPSVRSVYFNAPLSYENEGATELTGVDRLRRDATLRNGSGMPYTGKGVAVLVNDSGIDGTHGDLQYGTHVVQNVLAQTNLHSVDALLPITFVEGVPHTDVAAGHGTHVAGIVGGTGAKSAGGRMEGVAPGADLVGYGSGAALFVLDTLGGFDYALTHQTQYGIRVVSNSFGNTGDTGTPFDPEDPTNLATKRLADRNVVVVFSAGNAGPGESTITGNFKKAPWVVTVAAGDKAGNLSDFSSRGAFGGAGGGTVEIDGESFTWVDRPTIIAPGDGIYSARDSLSDGLGLLSAQEELEEIGPAELPYYTKLSGTSMAAPHVSGIVALLLEANPQLGWREVKKILQDTATNVGGRASWEGGAGYVNAHAAIRAARGLRQYPEASNINRTFNANAQLDVAAAATYDVPFSPVGTPVEVPFEVGADVAVVLASANVGENTVAIAATDPNGNRYGSSIALPVLGQNIAISAPGVPGTWKLTVRGVGSVSGAALDPAGVTNGYGLPGTVSVNVKQVRSGSYTGLSDVGNHAAKGFIQLAVRERLVDGDASGLFRPDAPLTRGELADWLVMGGSVRQAAGTPAIADVAQTDVRYAFAAAVSSRGAALHDQRGVAAAVLPLRGTKFEPNAGVSREDLAYALVQALGLEAQAKAFTGNLTALYNGTRVPVQDQGAVSAARRGYVQLALDLGLIPAQFALVPGGFAQPPTMVAYFAPAQGVTRADYAAASTRTVAVLDPAAL